MKKLLILLLIAAILPVSGCISGMGPEDIAKMSGEVKNFLDQYPDAKMTASYLKSDYVNSTIDQIREECGEQMEVTNYWRVDIRDPTTGMNITTWIDEGSRQVVCVVKKGGAPCTENWVCDEYGCINGTTRRNCSDLNNCGTTKNKPQEIGNSCTFTGRTATGFQVLGAPTDWDLAGDGTLTLNLVNNKLATTIIIYMITATIDGQSSSYNPIGLALGPSVSRKVMFATTSTLPVGSDYSIRLTMLYNAGGLNHTDTGTITAVVGREVAVQCYSDSDCKSTICPGGSGTPKCNVHEGGCYCSEPSSTTDQLVFISPPGCINCDKLEPIARDVANTLKIAFVKTSYGQQIQNPGIFLIYHGTSTITGVDSEYTLKTQVCLITKDTEICDQAKNLKPPADGTQPPTTNIPKTDKVNVKFFTMSYCPYGNQAESGLIPVYKLLTDKVEWEPHYVIYENYKGGSSDYCIENGLYCSMHGIQELNEDIRELCIWKYETHDKFFDYLDDVNSVCNAQNADSCWENVAQNHLIGTDRIKQCQQTEGAILIKAEYELNQEYGVQGSPTVFINDAEYSGGRAPEDYKTAICSGFNSPPAECQQKLGSRAMGAGSGGGG